MKIDILETDLEFESLLERDTTDMIVLHHTGENDIDASTEQIHEWHLGNGWAGIGYHYVIRKDGTIERGRPEWAIGSHAYGENSHSIGIHLSGDFMQAKPTVAQIEKCAMLIADICERYEIPIDREHVVGHGELMDTSCPGMNLQTLLDDGTITGKANWYANESDRVKRYNISDDLPEWAKPTIEKLIGKGLLAGDGENLDLSMDMLRILVIHDRAGLYG